MNIPEQTFDAHLDAGKAIQKSGYSLMRIQVFSPNWEMEPNVEFWIFGPDGKKIGQIDGAENEAIANAALAGIENHVKRSESTTYDLRRAVADYMKSEGCSCCQDVDAHKEHEKRLAELLEVEAYDDGSGYNFSKYRSDKQ